MKLVIDTNIIISALIRNNLSRNIINNLNYEFLTPDFSLDEISKYKEEICKKSGLDENEFYILIDLLFLRIDIIPFSEYNFCLEKAKEIIGGVDIDDVPFMALALIKQIDGIWSDDEHFRRQDTIKIWKTKDLLKLL